MKAFNTILLTLSVLCCSLTPVQAAKVMGVRSYRAPDYTRLVFDLDSSLQYQIDNKEDGRRLVIRLKNSTVIARLDGLTLANTPITKLSANTGSDHEVQVEIALGSRVEPRSFTLGKNEQYGDRLVVDLYDLNPKFEPMPDDKSDPIGTLSASVATSGKRDIIVALSAGHGGDDPGAIGHRKLQEKQVTLAISRELAAQLNRIPGYKAVLIRDDDYYVPLRERIRLGHDKKADLYLAIHADAADNKSANGATVYALSERGATSEQARRLADKENNADLIGGVGPVSLNDKDAVLASVLLDLSMTASVASSLEIGQAMIRSLDHMTKLRRNNVEQAAFVELKSADIPSLLIESGYITNAEDAERLDSPAWRKQFAGALADGITRWFGERPPRGTLISWQKEQGKEASAPPAAVRETAVKDAPAKEMPAREAATKAQTPKEVATREPVREKEAPVATPAAPATYTVRTGDSLSSLAQRFHVTMGALKSTNNLRSNSVQLGQVLRIPSPHKAMEPVVKKHRITPGETLSQIATLYEVSLDAIRATNQLKSDNIRPGQILKIPAS